MATIVAFLLLAATAWGTSPAEDGSWVTINRLVGMATGSRGYREATNSFGTPTSQHEGDVETYNFHAYGISVRVRGGYVVAVEIRLAPGKAIKDVRYTGGIPKRLLDASGSPEYAIRILGRPLHDESHGYRRLTYPTNGMLMTLYYGPQLDFIVITKELTELPRGNTSPPPPVSRSSPR